MPDASDRSAETFTSGGFVEFLHTGQAVAGEFYCSGCGYGVIVELELPRCPMCSGTGWERPGWGALRQRLTEQLR